MIFYSFCYVLCIYNIYLTQKVKHFDFKLEKNEISSNYPSVYVLYLEKTYSIFLSYNSLKIFDQSPTHFLFKKTRKSNRVKIILMSRNFYENQDLPKFYTYMSASSLLALFRCILPHVWLANSILLCYFRRLFSNF